MSTITDPLEPACSGIGVAGADDRNDPARNDSDEVARPGRMVLHVALALGTWFLLAVGLTPLLPLSDTVVAFGAPERLLRALPDGALRTLGAGPGSVSLAIESPAQVRALYASGAWLVLPASRSACLASRTVEPPRMPRPVM